MKMLYALKHGLTDNYERLVAIYRLISMLVMGTGLVLLEYLITFAERLHARLKERLSLSVNRETAGSTSRGSGSTAPGVERKS